MVKSSSNTMDRKVQKKLVRNMSINGEFIESLQIDEIRRNGPAKAIASLSDVNRAAVRTHPPEPTSGLIEMQRLLAKLGKK